MKINNRLICSECAPKLQRAELTYRRTPGKDDFAKCAFCGRERMCKAYQIMTQKDR